MVCCDKKPCPHDIWNASDNQQPSSKKKRCYIEAATWLAASIKLRADWSTAAGVKYRNDMMFIRIHHILSVLFNFIQPQSPTCHKHSTEKIQLRMQVQSSVESGYCGVFSPGLQILSQFKAPVLKMGHLPLRVSIRQLSQIQGISKLCISLQTGVRITTEM